MPIYDLSYQHYEGPRTHRYPWWSIARVSAISILKNRKSGAYLLFIYFTLFVAAVLIYTAKATADYIDQIVKVSPDTEEVGIRLGGQHLPVSIILFRYIGILLWPIFLFVLTHGPSSVSAERQNGALVLILARPLRRRHYVLGKTLGIVGAPVGSALVCIAGCFVLLWSNFLSFSQMLNNLKVLAASLSYFVVLGALLGLSVIGFTAGGKNVRTSLTWLYFYWLGPLIFAGALARSHLELLGSLLSPLYVLDGLYFALTSLDGKWVAYNPLLSALARGKVPIPSLVLALGLHTLLLSYLSRKIFVGVR